VRFFFYGIWLAIRMEILIDAATCQATGEGLGVLIVSQHALLARNNGDIVTLDVEGLPLLQQWYFVYASDKQLSHVAHALIAIERTHGGIVRAGSRSATGTRDRANLGDFRSKRNRRRKGFVDERGRITT
jgi:hypothetical protein